MKKVESVLFWISVVIIVILIGCCAAVMKMSGEMFSGDNPRYYHALVTKDNWPFKFEIKPSFNNLYYHLTGFQDHLWYVAISGDKNDIECLAESIRNNAPWLGAPSVDDIVDINSELKPVDPDYKLNGWNLNTDGKYKWYRFLNNHGFVVVDLVENRLYYNAFTE